MQKNVFHRTRVVINVDSSIEIERAGKRVNMKNKTCSIGDGGAGNNGNGMQVVCFTFQACLRYSGINVDDTKDFMLRYELDPKKVNRRLYFKNAPERSGLEEVIRMRKGEKACRRHSVYLLVISYPKRFVFAVLWLFSRKHFSNVPDIF